MFRNGREGEGTKNRQIGKITNKTSEMKTVIECNIYYHADEIK
jgi:hypothetical protein